MELEVLEKVTSDGIAQDLDLICADKTDLIEEEIEIEERDDEIREEEEIEANNPTNSGEEEPVAGVEEGSISVQVSSTNPKLNTFKNVGEIMGRPVTILLDSGSTPFFGVAKEIKPRLLRSNPLSLILGLQDMTLIMLACSCTGSHFFFLLLHQHLLNKPNKDLPNRPNKGVILLAW